MAVDPNTLIAPLGPVETQLFPGEAEGGSHMLHARMTSYVNQGVAKIAPYTFADTDEEDLAITAYALYLAFRAAYTIMVSRPADDDTGSPVLGRQTYQKDQREALKELYQSYHSEFQMLVSNASVTRAASTGIPSHQTRIEFDW